MNTATYSSKASASHRDIDQQLVAKSLLSLAEIDVAFRKAEASMTGDALHRACLTIQSRWRMLPDTRGADRNMTGSEHRGRYRVASLSPFSHLAKIVKAIEE